MRILMVGTGYVGLVTGACLAEMGHHVICLDIDEKKIQMLKDGKIPIYEPGLEDVVKHNLKDKRLFFTTDYKWAVANSYVCFLAVPTPSSEDGSCDVSYIERAAKEIAKHMKGYRILVNKSTVPPGTAHHVKKIVRAVLDEREKKCDFDVASNPEFLKEGDAVSDCMKPDRIVIGTESPRSSRALKDIYSPFCFNHDCIIEMDIISAEMTKYAANAMLATRISFMNEMAEICERIGADVNQVRKGIGSDSRIGYSFLYAGVGYGGSCFPKDIRALSHVSKKYGYIPHLLDAVESINNKQKRKLSRSIEKYFAKDGGIKGKTIAIWGLSFKPDTDDMREAPSLSLIDYLHKKGAILRLYDPVAMPIAKELLNKHENIIWCEDEFEAAHNADAITLLTEWKQFRHVDFSPIVSKMNQLVFFDGRNQYKGHEMRKRGFDYIGIGVPKIINNGKLQVS